MSQDLQIAFPCSHVIHEDRATLSTDRKELLLPTPIGSAAMVRILANQRYDIPVSGLSSRAKIVSGRAGPFQIISGRNELEIQTSDSVHSVLLPTGRRVMAGDVVSSIQEALGSDRNVSVSKKDGRIVLEEQLQTGLSSRILLGGDAASAIGFDSQRGARGRNLFPGWTPFSKPSDSLLNSPTFRGLRFHHPVKGNWFFQVSYSAPPSLCPRCRGTRVENDWRADEAGLLMLVKDENLLVQATQKILLSVVRSNPFHAWYGTKLPQLPGLKAVGNVAPLVQEEARRALEIYQQLQTKQARYQRISPEERLSSIDSIRAFPVKGNPTAYALEVVVRNGSSRPVSLNIVFTVPGVVALSGSNGLSLGTEAAGLAPTTSGIDLRLG